MLNDQPPTEAARPSDDTLWTRMARDAWESSHTWFDSSLRKQFEEAMAHFHSTHAPGSKYHTEAYKKKSKFFRPKTRSAIRRNEMAMAVALFSTDDIVHCRAVNEADDRQVLAAEIKNQILNHRLNDPQTLWYLTSIGGAQEAMNLGCVISRQHWLYRERKIPVDRYVQGADGVTEVQFSGDREIVEDRPAIDLIPVENLRISQSADWRNPIHSSPFVIELVPMYVWEVHERAQTIDPESITAEKPEGEYLYAPVDDPIMRASIEHDWDSVRKIRQGIERIDRYQSDDTRINEYRTVWVHRNIIRIDGYDFCYDTLGPDVLLSRPKPIDLVYRHGMRPYRMGFSIIEAHRLYPSGVPQLTFSSQEYTNDLANLRQDNVRLTLNKRYWVRRGSQTDVRSLIRNVAGGVTMMSDPGRDVKETSTPDVTRSSYEEQDRLDADFDDIAGTFSHASINSNRNLNETVGGMKLLHGGADQMQEYMIRTIAETWIEPVLHDVLKLEEAYESDLDFLTMIAAKNNVSAKDVLLLLKEPTQLKINVGFGSTNPQSRIEKLHLGLGTLAKFFPSLIQQADQKEVAQEVFGSLGYRDGSRFLPHLYSDDQDPMVTQLQEQVQMLTQMLEGKQLEMQSREKVAQIGAEARVVAARISQETALMKEQAAGNMEQFRASLQNRMDEIDAQLKIATEERERMRLALEREALSHSIMQANRDFALRARESDQKRLKGTTAHDLPGDDSAGVISRGNYGAIPDSPM